MNYRMRLLSLKSLLVSFLLGCCLWASAQYTIPQKPEILYPVYDEAGLLTKEEKDRLNQKLIKFEDSTSTEIEVIIIPSTKGEDINFLATKFGEKWGIGKKKVDNGVVFLIATEDRTMSIQQGRAVEQYLTASVAGQIMDYLVTPYFRQGNWYKGIDEGTNAVMEALQGKFKPQKRQDDDSEIYIAIIFLAILIFIVMVASRNRNNRNGGGGFFGYDDENIVISRRGRRTYPGGFINFPPMGGGPFGGGSSGGGFGGFGGGGSFGGGGASGSW